MEFNRIRRRETAELQFELLLGPECPRNDPHIAASRRVDSIFLAVFGVRMV